jgi:arsenate reductase
MRTYFGDRFTTESAGIAPAGLNPRAVKVMAEIGIDISKQRSKSIWDFNQHEFDYLIILCCHVRTAVRSTLPKGMQIMYRGFESPNEMSEDEEAILSEFRNLRDEMKEWLSEIFSQEADNESTG